MSSQSQLFEPLQIRGVSLPNRLVISPMCQYSADDGLANDWHLAHLGKLAQGGAAVVFTEAVAVQRRGRITHGDLGIWADAQAQALAGIARFISSMGSVPAIQLAHAGRKASMQRPWHGNGPLDDSDRARGDEPWPVVGPSAIALGEGWLVPSEMTQAEIAQVVEDFATAALRADNAGFGIAEVHAAHGYLAASFLSPISNHRTDIYGGDRAGRSRMLLETAEAVRAAWPHDKPLFVRVSAVDGAPQGWSLEDTVALAKDLKGLGVDVIDCSSGGILGSATAAKGPPPQPGFQVPYAQAVKEETGLMTQAVGFVLTPHQAEDIVAKGQADLVAIGREALDDPNWPLHAALALDADQAWEHWPVQYGWWLSRRAKVLQALRETTTTA
ncbi:MAG: NADH:flavin oxidoreductase/NADH oxidase [Acidiferrobacteraceae bacterium]|nr:NADH:flavin oxidoreductase/NADH oxidase [Acidiferrobacteraceae bacterium]